MNIRSFKIKSFLIAIMMLICATVVLAQENVISSVTISKSKFDPTGYELNIDSSQAVHYKSYIDDEDNIYFDLKNSILAKNLGTIYDDVVNVDNLTVKQLDKNRVRIYLNGKNVKNTEVVFVNSLFETTQTNSAKVTINRPINEYKSTSYHNQDLEAQDDIQAWDDNSFNLTHLGSTILFELKDGLSGSVLILLLVLIVIGMIAKNLAAKMSQENEPLIGLNNSKYLDNSFEIGTNKIVANKVVTNNSANVPQRKNISTKVLNAIQNENQNPSRTRALAAAQEELTKAHQKYQQYLQNKYNGAKKPASIDIDVIKKGIALSQYQKSTQNPYSNQEVIKMNQIGQNIQKPMPKKDFSTTPKKPLIGSEVNKKEFTSPYIQRKTNFVDASQLKTKSNMKFLDSVTQIYERSGRSDLADGLKKSITKTKQII